MKLIREHIEAVKYLTETSENGKKNLYIEGTFLVGDTVNKNNRMYEMKTLRNEWFNSSSIIVPELCNIKIGTAFRVIWILPFVDQVNLLILTEETVSLPSKAKFAKNTLAVPGSTTLIIEADLSVLVISNAILF